jgi:hypothetical protein
VRESGSVLRRNIRFRTAPRSVHRPCVTAPRNEASLKTRLYTAVNGGFPDSTAMMLSTARWIIVVRVSMVELPK